MYTLSIAIVGTYAKHCNEVRWYKIWQYVYTYLCNEYAAKGIGDSWVTSNHIEHKLTIILIYDLDFEVIHKLLHVKAIVIVQA